MNRKPLFRVGLIGHGFMGRTHANAYRQAGAFFELPLQPILQTVCGRDVIKTEAFARNWGFSSFESDWRRVVERKDIDAIDICVPNNLHAEIAIAAAQAGKAVLCEKPLAMNADEGQRMCEAVERAQVPNTVWYNYRRVPAVMLARKLVESGTFGRVFHYRASFLQDWTISKDVPQGGAALWRLDAAAAGSGVTGDLLAHCVDTAMWLNGPILEVGALTETFVKERRHQETGVMMPVRIDDAVAVLCRFANGALGVFESSRFARGHKAAYLLELNGEHGSVRWNLEDLHRLELFEHRDAVAVRGWRSIHVTDGGGEHPYMENWWVPGLQIGYEHTFIHQVADFLLAVAQGRSSAPTFRDALDTQRVCDAILRAAAERTWVSVEAHVKN